MVTCPQCNEVMDVDEDELDEGDSLTCEQCGANLSVSGLAPLELTADEEDDDEEDDDEEDDDFDEDEDFDEDYDEEDEEEDELEEEEEE
jgi:alpha-aminoadipate carrier protein LysW